MQYLSKEGEIFNRRQRRRRVQMLTFAVVAAAAADVMIFTARASAQTVDAFDRLVAPTGLVEDEYGAARSATYVVIGTQTRFVLQREGRTATIRFLCEPGTGDCPEGAPKAQPLTADRASRGALLFKSASGKPVLQLATTGGATLYGGASYVPRSVPESGKPVAAVR